MPTSTADLSKLQREFMHRHRAQHQKIVESLGLYYGQPIMLMKLFEEGELTQKELSEEMNITPASVAVSVKRMEKAGLLIRQADPSDLRFNKVNLTAKGSEIARKCKNGFHRVDELCFRGFSQQELETLREYFERMIQNLIFNKEESL